uniref:hypothetical protein n=1 Tax=Gracilaria urvillei TaxID=172974 RepID=UPI001D1214DA|nr:hypothetical protein LK147_pgp123 [Hydropuntia urvillei]UAD88417.1 hypothetical protein [Hydropuntia urvillei]
MNTCPYFLYNIDQWLKIQNIHDKYIVSEFLQSTQITNTISSIYKVYGFICDICLHGIEWFNFKFINIPKKTYNIKKVQIILDYISYNYKLFDLNQNFYNYKSFVNNLHLISVSIKTYINLYINKNKPIYRHLIYYYRNFLYSKDSLKRWRFSSYATYNKLKEKIFLFLATFLESHNISASFRIIVRLYKLFLSILYFWHRKKYKRIFELNLYNKWNKKLFFVFVLSIKKQLLFIVLSKQINR